MTLSLSIVAIGCYLFAAAWWGVNVFRAGAGTAGLKSRLVAYSAAALILHAVVLYQTVLTGAGLDLGFYNALSLISWTVALLVVAVLAVRPVENLTLVFLPLAALALLLEQAFPGQRLVADSAPTGVRAHIVLSIGAYGLLAMAAVQALVLAVQESLLRRKHPVQAMRVLPPLQAMEDLLVQFLIAGFFLLSLSLATGFMFVEDIMGQHLAHKTVLSSIAWLTFGMLLAGRWTRGWRGGRLVRWTLGGFILLVLAYFGSKLVLELILHRV